MNQKISENASTGEKIAIALVVFLTASYLTISIWSAAVLLTGTPAQGGPIGLICRLIHPA